MAETGKVLYIVVVDDVNDDFKRRHVSKNSFRYTRSILQSTLQLMGCKARHAFKVCLYVISVVLFYFRSIISILLIRFCMISCELPEQIWLSYYVFVSACDSWFAWFFLPLLRRWSEFKCVRCYAWRSMVVLKEKICSALFIYLSQRFVDVVTDEKCSNCFALFYS